MSESSATVAAAAGAAAISPVSSGQAWPTRAHSWYAVTLFGFTIFTLFAALPITGLVITQIKTDFHLNDKQVALLVSSIPMWAVSYTHLRAHETPEHLVCRL